MNAATELCTILSKLLPEKHAPYYLHEPCMDQSEELAVSDCIRSGFVSSVGAKVTEFERELSKVLRVEHTICVSNGTSALHALLFALGISQGQEVLCPALTFVGTANAIVHAGAIPHFVDCEEKTFGVDADKLRMHLLASCEVKNGKLINQTTNRVVSALIVVNIFGHSADMSALSEVAEEFNLFLIEDAAESLGACLNGKELKTQAYAGMTSFNGNKIITTGGGGAIFTNDSLLADKIRHLTTTAKKPHPYEFNHDLVGFNYRMPNLNAALGLAQLSKLPLFLDKKRKIAATYREAFSDAKHWEFVTQEESVNSNHWLNAVKLKQPSREALIESLEKINAAKIHCRPVWEPLHTLPMYGNSPKSSLITTEKLSQQLINLPSSPQLSDMMHA